LLVSLLLWKALILENFFIFNTQRVLWNLFFIRVFLLPLPKFLLHLQIFFKFSKKSFDHLRKLVDTTLPKLCWLLKVKIYDFRKWKYIIRSRFLKVKIYHWKLTFENQNVSSEVDFWKSKIIIGSWLPEVKKYFQKQR